MTPDVDLAELRALVAGEGVTLVDVRTPAEYAGLVVAPCDPRPGRIPGAVSLPLDELTLLTAEEIANRLGAPTDGSAIVAYCHTGQRSAFAVEILERHGYTARNYAGSWHEWSRDPTLPTETG